MKKINQALEDLPETGGEIRILGGVYNLEGAIHITRDNTIVKGNGNSTILKRMYSSTAVNSGITARGMINLNGVSDCEISNLQIDGNRIIYNGSSNKGVNLFNCNNSTITKK